MNTAQSGVIVVPIRMVDADPMIEVIINGSPIDVQFDFGWGTTITIFPSQLESISNRRVGTASSRLSMTGPTGERPIYAADLFEIGDVSFANAPVFENFHDDEYQDSFSSRKNSLGFPGRGLFDTIKVVVDYQGQKLMLIPPKSPLDQQAIYNGNEFPLMQGQEWGLASKVITDIGDLVLVWDTGAPESGVLKGRTDSSELDFIDGDTLSTERFVFGN